MKILLIQDIALHLMPRLCRHNLRLTSTRYWEIKTVYTLVMRISWMKRILTSLMMMSPGNKLYEIWKPSQAFKLMDIENDYFLVTFRSRTDYSHVPAAGPWLVFGYYILVEPWTKDFTTAQPYPSKIIAWICLPGLPMTLYKRSLITELGECIGRVLKLDYRTETGQRGKFARMTVQINLNKPLVSKIVVNGKIQLVEYESLHTVCFNCGKYGHMNDNCPDLQPSPTTEAPPRPSEPIPAPPATIVPISESRFTPILDVNTNDPPPPALWISTNAQSSSELTRPSTSNLPAASKRVSKSKSAPPKHTSATLKKSRSSTAEQHAPTFNVHKPLQLNFADFSILSRNDHRAGSSRQVPSPTDISHLDRSKRSSIFLPENSDPNIQNVDTYMPAPNGVGELPKKPPDPVISASPTRD
ncbi:hypothetical protein V6N11_065091 [Hibiscus sabdariffa]|uniref:CCHC-type domain-containing protein n=1 Tax=Hibiscus sabdariffa TaxID=183260 RepID=A0ABR2SIY6_9ROSI